MRRHYKKLKKALCKVTVLKYYSVNDPWTLSVDVASKAMGAVLLQRSQPLTYATKCLNKSEQDYPQIVKEAYAIRFGCKEFHDYIWRKDVTVEKDYKPLETI